MHQKVQNCCYGDFVDLQKNYKNRLLHFCTDLYPSKRVFMIKEWSHFIRTVRYSQKKRPGRNGFCLSALPSCFWEQKCVFCRIFVDFCIVDWIFATKMETWLLIFVPTDSRHHGVYFLVRWSGGNTSMPSILDRFEHCTNLQKYNRFTKMSLVGGRKIELDQKTRRNFEVWVLKQLLSKNKKNRSS